MSSHYCCMLIYMTLLVVVVIVTVDGFILIPSTQTIRVFVRTDTFTTTKATTIGAPLFRLSSSSLSSIDTVGEDDDDAATATTVQSRSVVATPEFKGSLTTLMESLQRIIQTMSMIVLQQLNTNNDSSESSVQEIVREILQLCDEYDQIIDREQQLQQPQTTTDTAASGSSNNAVMERFSNLNSHTVQQQIRQFVSQWSMSLQKGSIRYQRYESLVRLMQLNYTSYITTATFLSSNNKNKNIQRYELPNVQDVPYTTTATTTTTSSSSSLQQPRSNDTKTTTTIDDDENMIVPDCTLDNLKYKDNALDTLLLSIFRRLVTKHTGGIISIQSGINGLLEQGRTYMIQEQSNPMAQHMMVQNTLRDLMTPILPLFYRIFMSGIIPKVQFQNITLHPMEQQYGPWFYAPFLTSYITPIFFAFLVGPSYPNRHIDGSFGGLLVEKCKFLQESNCKGLCLHQCKIPAQTFFNETLGLSLNVVPNFVTQECQWNFNELPITPVDNDPSFPKGCISGCTSRNNLLTTTTTKSSVNFCN